jgi:hypothetical protein
MDIRTEEDWRRLLQSMLDDDSLREILFNIYGRNAVTAEHTFAVLQGTIGTDTRHCFMRVHRAWEDAPDHIKIHSWPRWHDLCDLCSEYGVWDAERPDEEEPAF